MSAADALTLPLISPHSVNGGRDPTSTSIGALDTQSQTQEKLQMDNRPTPPKILNNGTSTFSQDKESAMADEGREALERYQAKLNRYFMAASILFVVNTLSLVGGIVFSQTEWAGFIDPILDSILPEPSPVPVYPTLPLPWALRIVALMAKPIPLYFPAAAMRLVYVKKSLLEDCEGGWELEDLAEAEESDETELIWEFIRYSLGGFIITLLQPTDSSRHKLVIRRTLTLLLMSVLLWSFWDVMLAFRSELSSTSEADSSNQPAQCATTSNDIYNTSEASSQDTEKQVTAQ